MQLFQLRRCRRANLGAACSRRRMAENFEEPKTSKNRTLSLPTLVGTRIRGGFGLVRFGSLWFGLVRFGSVRFGSGLFVARTLRCAGSAPGTRATSDAPASSFRRPRLDVADTPYGITMGMRCHEHGTPRGCAGVCQSESLAERYCVVALALTVRDWCLCLSGGCRWVLVELE